MSTLAVLLKESWSAVEDRADEVAQNFFARLFLADPGLRELFPIEMHDLRSRFLGGLVTIMQAVDEPERFDEILRGLGRCHRKFHVRTQHYALVGTALLEAVRSYAGPRWSIEYDQAWRDVYDAMATKMLGAAERESASPAFWPAEVLAHSRRGHDIATITCRPLMPYPFRAGQYASVETPHHPRAWRTYSIANAPRADGTLDFHVRAPDDGWVSAALVRRLRVGDMVRLGPPMGVMALDRNSPRHVVGIAGGTGLAPIKSIAEDMARYNRTRWAHLFVGARHPEGLYDLPALARLAERHRWLSVIPACSDDDSYPGEHGNICDVVTRYGPWPAHEFFVSGSAAMVNATLGSLARAGVPPTRVHYDALTDLPELLRAS